MRLTENLNILELKPLIPPDALKRELPIGDSHAETVLEGRRAIEAILSHKDDRLMAIVGPCSIHDEAAAADYAGRLAELAREVCEKVLVVMRTYFEKPRTSVGWKGLLYDPGLDNTDDIEEGVHKARRILLAVTGAGLPTATEVLDPIVPQYLCDLVAWVAVGARTTESQIHRQMASGLSMPIGFKNATDGNLSVAIDAITACSKPHAFLGIDSSGRAAVATTRGNAYGHLVLRGGNTGPNYQSEYVAFAEVLMRKAGIANGLIVDCSHANSHKRPSRQREVLADVIAQRESGNRTTVGVMLESFLREGAQPVAPPGELEYGKSITDACIGWEETAELLHLLAEGV